jgi:hypothetical protein
VPIISTRGIDNIPLVCYYTTVKAGYSKGITIYEEDYNILISRKAKGQSMANLIHEIVKISEPHYNRQRSGRYGKKR